MKYIDEFRQKEPVLRLSESIHAITTKPHSIMEICGGQTHAIMRFGIDQLLPDDITLIHGPGCPVCVTPIDHIDQAISLAQSPKVILCTFGDMMRVPGSKTDLLRQRASGANVQIVYSPMDAVALADQNPDSEVVFFGVGFETTAPTVALALKEATLQGIKNFSILSSHVLVPPAMRALLESDTCVLDGFLAAGHVCTVMGYHEYEPLVERYKVPIIVTGFEPFDILQGIHMCVKQLESGEYGLDNQYRRCVTREGNRKAQELMQQVFEITSRDWRGLGSIPDSGYSLRNEYRNMDAKHRFSLPKTFGDFSTSNFCGNILSGIKKPYECPHFGKECTPDSPVGAPMVSSEGACAAYYRYSDMTGKGA